MTPRPVRLKKRSQFLAVAAKARKAPAPGLVLQALHRDDDEPVRVGYTVTKKVGNSVIRNRARRRLRAAFACVDRETPLSGADLVLIGRQGTGTRVFTDLVADLRRALQKTGVRGA